MLCSLKDPCVICWLSLFVKELCGAGEWPNRFQDWSLAPFFPVHTKEMFQPRVVLAQDTVPCLGTVSQCASQQPSLEGPCQCVLWLLLASYVSRYLGLRPSCMCTSACYLCGLEINSRHGGLAPLSDIKLQRKLLSLNT